MRTPRVDACHAWLFAAWLFTGSSATPPLLAVYTGTSRPETRTPPSDRAPVPLES
jgi:hypothetical protein